MSKFKKISIVFLLIIFVGCASRFMGLDMRISGAMTPNDIIGLAGDIQRADISAAEKRNLNIKLAKRTLNIAELYIKMTVDGKKMPQKEDILGIIKALSKSLGEIDENELAVQITDIIKNLSMLLLR